MVPLISIMNDFVNISEIYAMQNTLVFNIYNVYMNKIYGLKKKYETQHN